MLKHIGYFDATPVDECEHAYFFNDAYSQQ